MKKKTTAATTEEIVTPKWPKQEEIPMSGDGVGVTTDKDLIRMSDERIEFNDSKKTATKGLKDTDANILNRMNILGLTRFRVGDKLFVNDAKHKLKVTNVKGDISDSDTASITDKSL